MSSLDEQLKRILFEKRNPIDWSGLRIETPEGLPLNVKSRLDSYNEAITRFDLEKAEAVADEIFEWLDESGMVGVILEGQADQ